MVLVCWGWFLVVRGQVEGNHNGWDGFWWRDPPTNCRDVKGGYLLLPNYLFKI